MLGIRRSRGRCLVATATTTVAVMALAGTSTAAGRPQVVDPANDANGGTYWRSPDTPTPVGSQPYADVTSVEFRTTRTTRIVHGRRVPVVSGFTVSMRLAEPPVPPGGSIGMYRVMASGPGCLFGVDYYTQAPDGQPQAAVQDWCRPPAIRRTTLAPPTVTGNMITWKVPLSAVPGNARVAVGTTLTDLHFEALVKPHAATCTGTAATPAEEQPPCAFVLDNTFVRDGTYTIR